MFEIGQYNNAHHRAKLLLIKIVTESQKGGGEKTFHLYCAGTLRVMLTFLSHRTVNSTILIYYIYNIIV